ncbi:MAG: methyltransferase domain-containing protein [Jatrophihabitantaceae bacterium]
MRWDPTQYSRYSDERGRPFLDLVARVGASAPRRVVDLGCGPGNLTALLAERWPAAIVEGVDSSPEMIERAAAVPGVDFRVGDVRTWQVPLDCDVIVSNATLQWVPSHLALMRAWAAALPSGGWLAVQVPGNFDSPSHTLMRTLATSPRWAPLVGDVLRHRDAVSSPSVYASLLLEAGLDVDVWETTYQHRLQGADPVLEWVRGTGLRPILAALAGRGAPPGAAFEAGPSDAAFEAGPSDAGPSDAAFEAEYAALLRSAYPATAHGTLFPFRRIFAVATKA